MNNRLLSCSVLVLLVGCITSDDSKWLRPIWPIKSSRTDPTDSLVDNTKAARIRQIKELAGNAQEMSPAEKMTASTKLAEQVKSESDPLLQIELVRALGSFPTPSSIEGLRQALQAERPNIRIAACRSLTKIHSAQSLEVLAEVAHGDSNLDVRAAAVQGLGQFKDERALRALAEAINDRDPAIQYLAVKSMQRVHGENLGENLSAWKDLSRRILGTNGESDRQVELAEFQEEAADP